MADQTVTLVLDAAQYHREIAKITSATAGLARSGERIGQGFVSGERVVRRATQGITQGLLSVNSVADASLLTFASLERVFKIGLGPTIAIAGGIKAFELFREQVKKTNEAYKDLKEALEKPIDVDPEVKKAQDKIDELSKKIKTLQDQINSPVSKTSGFFAGLAAIASQAFLPSFLRGPAISALSGLAPTGPGAANELIGRATTAIELLTNRREAAFYQSLDKLSAAIDKTAEKVQAPFRNLFQDIGSGQFVKDFFQRRGENAQVTRGQQIAAEFDEFEKAGGTLGPIEKAMVEAVRKAGAGGGFSLNDLATTDFSNLDQLSKYDFGGLAPLSGMTLIVK